MKRRTAIKLGSLALAGAAGSWFLYDYWRKHTELKTSLYLWKHRIVSGSWRDGGGFGFGPEEITLLDSIADTIIPATDTPGAKAAHVGTFIAMMVDECYDIYDQAIFVRGAIHIADTYKAQYGHAFSEGSTEQRTQFLRLLDVEKPRYLQMMKELTVQGFFTSEIGCTQTLRYVETPGRYDGNVSHRRGDKAWAT